MMIRVSMGPVEVAVLNAGIGTQGRFSDLDREKEVREVRLNCVAVVDLAAHVLPGMVASIDVLSGKRTVLDYFWQPIAKTKDKALRD